MSPHPLWRAELRSLGFYVDEHSPTGRITALKQIAFGNIGELVVISDEGAPPKEPNPVRAFVLDAATGRVVKRADWVAKGAPYIFATARGRYVANTLDGLVVFSLGLEQVLGRYDGAASEVSPDGRGVTVRGGVPGSGVALSPDGQLLAVSSLGVVQVFVLPALQGSSTGSPEIR